MKKYLPIIPLLFWIFLYPMIGGIIYWKTNYAPSLYLGLIGIIAIFNLVWYLAKLNYQKEHLDLATIVGNLIILNIFAYWLISYYYNDQEKKLSLKKPINQNLNYATWELEKLKIKKPQKYAKLISQDHQQKLQKIVFDLKDEVLKAFSVYLLVKIYQKNPDLVNTYQIITLFKKEIELENQFSQNILEFKEVDLKLFFNEEDLVKLNPDPKIKIYEILVNTSTNELSFVFKENRVKLQYKAKLILEELK